MPTGASLTSEFLFNGVESPHLDYLPERFPNFSNLSHITTTNLQFTPREKAVRLSGPSGSILVLALCTSSLASFSPSYAIDSDIFRSLNHPVLFIIQKLVVSEYGHPRPGNSEECPIFQTLSSMNNLRTLVLTNCNSLPFILALDPEQNPFNLLLSSNMEALIFCFKSWSLLNVDHLIRMAKNRASRGAKLSSIMFVDLGGQEQMELEEAFELTKHVARVEYRVDDTPPAWNDIYGEGSGRNEKEWV
jgi:hypothetical protein